MTDSLFHTCLAGITAFFLGLAYSYRSFSVGLIGFGLVFTATLHGLYDNFANGWLGAALAIAIVLVFVAYVATCDGIGAQFHEHPSTAPAKPPLSATWADRTWTAASSTPAMPAADPPHTTARNRDTAAAAAGSMPLARSAAGAGP